MPENNWPEYRKLVMKELGDLNEKYEKLDGKMDTVITEIALLKVKSGIWGAAAGAVPVIGLILYRALIGG